MACITCPMAGGAGDRVGMGRGQRKGGQACFFCVPGLTPPKRRVAQGGKRRGGGHLNKLGHSSALEGLHLVPRRGKGDEQRPEAQDQLPLALLRPHRLELDGLDKALDCLLGLV